MGHYDVEVMNESAPPSPVAPAHSARRKAIANWFMETSSLVLVFLVFEPALNLARPKDTTQSFSLPLWYYLPMFATALSCFLFGMRLHHEP
jgi:hypothetical protein